MHIDSNGVAAAGIALGLAALARVGAAEVEAVAAAGAGRRAGRRVLPRPGARRARGPERGRRRRRRQGARRCERLHDERFGDGEFLRIAVFLSVLDVHVNRSPVAGKVVDYFVADGGFANAMKPEAEHNVAAYTVLDTDRGTVVVAQRTGPDRPPDRAARAGRRAAGQGRAVRPDPVRLPHRRLPARRRPRTPLVAPGDRVVGGVDGHRPLALTRRTTRGTAAPLVASGGPFSSCVRRCRRCERCRSQRTGPLTR